MNTIEHTFQVCLLWAAIALAPGPAEAGVPFRAMPNAAPAIPWDQIGAKAGAEYHGAGLSVTATDSGARLHCVFQRLEGEATAQGLWLTSTGRGPADERFQVVAAQVGREAPATLLFGDWMRHESARLQDPASEIRLAPLGTVSVTGQVVRFARDGLVEEYSVSADGVRQDFVVTQRPAGLGDLRVQLSVRGAQVEVPAGRARLVLAKSGRRIDYGRLRATDANGKVLQARLAEVEDGSVDAPHAPVPALNIVVDDADAEYPVRIDPTFTDANWSGLGGLPGADGPLLAVVTDGSGNLYVGGDFHVVGEVKAEHIAKWDGSRWTSLGSGVNTNVYALAVAGDDLYAGGDFDQAGGSPANFIARWDGTTWSTLGSGMNSRVRALAISAGEVFAGGVFTTAGGTAANHVAKWNGSGWSALGAGMNTNVQVLKVSGDILYAGGLFTQAGGSPARYVAQWDGSSWSPLGNGMNNLVGELLVSGDDLYAGGLFTKADGNAVDHIAKWDGHNWSPVGSGLNGPVFALAVLDGNLLASGLFKSTDGFPTNYVAKWDGSTWTPVGLGMNAPAYTLTVFGSDLYVGGKFTMVGGCSADHLVKWGGNHWLAAGMNDQVYALAVSGDDLYAGGKFTVAGGAAANYVARWDGTSWSALGLGFDQPVEALAVSGNDLYAGGQFTKADGNPVNYVARWDGASWSPLGSGTDKIVHAMVMSGSGLYVGGEFATAGGIPAKNIAKWDGHGWSPLGLGVNNTVFALAATGNDLYAGGKLRKAGGNAANFVAKWDGTTWSPLGRGTDNYVLALAASGNHVYAGGYFNHAGGNPADYIAHWDGTNWSAMGSGMDLNGQGANVQSFLLSGTDLYVGGHFNHAGGIPADYLAKWDGHNWSALGSGFAGTGSPIYVYALAASGDRLYAGGDFTTAGGKDALNVAQAVPTAPAPLVILTTDGNLGFTDQQFHFTVTGPAGANAVISASTDLRTWSPVLTNSLTGGTFLFADPEAANYPHRFYRAALHP